MTPCRTAAFVLSWLGASACGSTRFLGDALFNGEVAKFVTRYEATYQRLYTARQEALWETLTGADPDAAARDERVRVTTRALWEFTGSIENIELSRGYLARKKELSLLVRRSLDTILLQAGNNPHTVSDLVGARIELETALREHFRARKLDLDGRATSTPEVDRILRASTDIGLRRRAWEAATTPDEVVRAAMARLRGLRNESVRALGHADSFAWTASEHGMSQRDFMRKIDEIERDMRPLYAELHTYARHELARRFGLPVPDLLPAHWLPSRFGEDWVGIERDREWEVALAAETPLQIAERAERLCVGLGLQPLPRAFWERSVLTRPGDDPSGGSHATRSVWHVDLDRDVRALLVIAPEPGAFAHACRVLGDAHASLEYGRPEIPIMLRRGASPAFHAAFGELLALAAQEPRALAAQDIASASAPEPIQNLLDEAFELAVPVIWSAGTLCHFERELHAGGLPATRWNRRFWELATQHQGIVAPEPRDERWCDPLTIPTVMLEPTRGSDRALAIVLAFQLHDHISRQILDQDPRDASYPGHQQVGAYLRSLLRRGAGADWRVLLRETTGYDVSARAMAEYFEPLRVWLVEQNRGRTSTLPRL